MTVLKDPRQQVPYVLATANKLLIDEIPDSTGTVNNGLEEVPAYLQAPTVITSANMTEEVIDTGYFTAEELGL